MNGKCCNICLREHPATADFFGRHSGRKTGLRENCIWCRRKVRAEERARAKERKRCSDMRIVANRLCAGALMPNADQVLMATMRRLGGPHALGAEFGRQLMKAPPSAYLRFAEAVLNLSEQAEHGDLCRPNVDRQELEEQQAALKKSLMEMLWERSQREEGV